VVENMLFLLLMMLLIMLFTAYIITNRDILSPWVISIYMFIVTVIIAILNYKDWNENITELTILIVMIGLICFGVGEIIGKSLFGRVRSIPLTNRSPLTENVRINIKNRSLIFTVFIICIVIYFNINHTLDLANRVGYARGMQNLLYYVRIAQFDANIDSSRNGILNLGLTYSTIISYFFIFVFLYNLIITNKSQKKYLLLSPALLNIINIILSTGRTQFINLITFILILLFLMLKQKYNWSVKLNNRIMLYGLLGIFGFLLVFRMSGYLTGKSNLYSIWDNISIYVGSPIIALSKYLDNPPERFLFGSETLYSVYHILRKTGLDIPQYNLNLEFISWNNVKNVNIYTALRRYVHDFGILGMSLIMIIIGFFYGNFYSYIKKKRTIDLYTIIYAMIFFPITQIALEERFFTNVISIQGIYNVIFMIVVWKLYINKKNILKIN